MDDFKLDIAGLNQLMKSAEMQSILSQAGGRIANSAGKGYSHQGYVINFVAIENIFPVTKEAAYENAEKHTLLKALGATKI